MRSGNNLQLLLTQYGVDLRGVVSCLSHVLEWCEHEGEDFRFLIKLREVQLAWDDVSGFIMRIGKVASNPRRVTSVPVCIICINYLFMEGGRHVGALTSCSHVMHVVCTKESRAVGGDETLNVWHATSLVLGS